MSTYIRGFHMVLPYYLFRVSETTQGYADRKPTSCRMSTRTGYKTSCCHLLHTKKKKKRNATFRSPSIFVVCLFSSEKKERPKKKKKKTKLVVLKLQCIIYWNNLNAIKHMFKISQCKHMKIELKFH